MRVSSGRCDQYRQKRDRIDRNGCRAGRESERRRSRLSASLPPPIVKLGGDISTYRFQKDLVERTGDQRSAAARTPRGHPNDGVVPSSDAAPLTQRERRCAALLGACRCHVPLCRWTIGPKKLRFRSVGFVEAEEAPARPRLADQRAMRSLGYFTNW
jgi:hypothetical protein